MSYYDFFFSVECVEEIVLMQVTLTYGEVISIFVHQVTSGQLVIAFLQIETYFAASADSALLDSYGGGSSAGLETSWVTC